MNDYYNDPKYKEFQDIIKQEEQKMNSINNSIKTEWNIICGNDAKNDYNDLHEVRCEHFKLNNGKYKAVYECEECDYYYTEVTNYPNMKQPKEIINE